ncbi:MAG: A24 family peptidase [Armatimonadetes bacterium]|nr:A24 family peptidase [Armatimonadota bacterium]
MGLRDFIICAVLFPLLLICAYTDVRFGKVRNVVTIPGMILGLAINTGFGGWSGLGFAAAGLGLAFGVFLLLSLLLGRVMGAGDAKLLMAVGSLVGPKLLVWSMVYGAVVGGMVAVGTALAKGRLKKEIVGLLTSIAGRLTGVAKLDYSESDSLRLPYAIPLGLGALIALAMHGGVTGI